MLSKSSLSALRSSRLTTGLRTTAVFSRTQQLRQQSSSSQPSLSGSFYKTFGRPIFKVVLSAIFVYQVAYFSWVKMETDEVSRERQAEIAGLEDKLSTLQAPVETSAAAGKR